MCSREEFNAKCRCPKVQDAAARVGVSAQDLTKAVTGFQIGRTEMQTLKRIISQNASKLGTVRARKYTRVLA